jgi:hypothetical protein
MTGTSYSSLGTNSVVLTNGAQLSVLVDSGSAETGKTFTLPNNVLLTGNGAIAVNRNLGRRWLRSQQYRLQQAHRWAAAR